MSTRLISPVPQAMSRTCHPSRLSCLPTPQAVRTSRCHSGMPKRFSIRWETEPSKVAARPDQ
ncbi:hypothetical protein QW131_15465 [Roseibium salinum]|nr:hypothetical protein [Roseibium salinum]